MIRAAVEDEEEAVPLRFVASMSMRDGAGAVLKSIRETLDLDLRQYRRRQVGERPGGFAYLREQAEKAGIYVLLMGSLGSHHTSLDVETFRGFALADELAPLIVTNDEDAETAWAFTLLHELCHIWLGATGISGANASSPVEQFCNDVAGQFFLPSNEIGALADLRGEEFENVVTKINNFAQPRNVSSSMVAYKLYRERIIERDLWSKLSAFYRAQWLRARAARRERSREREGGPNYYVVRRHRLGSGVIKLARRMLADNIWSPSKAAKVLGVKPSNIYRLVQGEAGRG
jgi:Zn-dependent peptidase ImmA (M78 family)